MICLCVFLTFSTLIPQVRCLPLTSSDWIRLTTNPSSDCDPTWSHDGAEIVYRAHSGSVGYIWIMSADGTDQRKLETHGTSEGPAVSHDDSKIAFGNYIGNNYFSLTVMNYDGTNFNHIYGGGSQGSLERMCWSPTGSRVVAQTTTNGASPPYQIITINADGSNPVQLTTEGNNRFPWYSPDGSKIVFASDRAGQSEIWVMDTVGGDQHRLTDLSGAQPKWSPDGSKIVFVHDGHIYMMNADGTNAAQLTASEEAEEFPEISPDGKWVVFTAYVNGLRNIYKMALPQSPFSSIWNQWWFWTIVALGLIVGLLAFTTVRYQRKTPVQKETNVDSSEPASVKYRTCPNCGASLPVGSKFCGKCGSPLE